MTFWIVLSLAAWLVITFLMLGMFRSASRADDRLAEYHRDRTREPRQTSETKADETLTAPNANVASALESTWDALHAPQTPDRVDG